MKFSLSAASSAVLLSGAVLSFSCFAHAQGPPATATTPKTIAPEVALTSSTHPLSYFYDFETPIISASPTAQYIPFAPYAVAGGVPSGAQFSVRDGALQISNAAHVSFGINLRLMPFDANQLSQMSFDYKLTPGVRVNIFFRIKGKYHGVTFCGPKKVRPGSVFLGALEDVRADDQWHHAHIPLRDWLQRLYPLDTAFPVDEVIIGNWDNSNYLMAGFGGNAPGVSWAMDNFALVGAQSAGAEAKIDVRGAGDTAIKTPSKYFYSVDGNAPQPLKSASLVLKAADGLHVVRVGEKKAGQSTLETSRGAARAFWMSATAPVVGAAQWDNNELAVPIQSAAGLNATGVKLAVGDKTFDFNSPFLHWDGRHLRLDAGRAGLRWADGAGADVKVSGIVDSFGRAAEARTTSVKTNYSKHTVAPPAPVVRLIADDEANAVANSGSFESGIEGWGGLGNGAAGANDALIDRDDSTAEAGKYSLRLTCPANAAPFRAVIRDKPLDVSRFPILSFDYRIPAALRVDFQLFFDNRPWKIIFTDKDGAYPSIGTVPGVIADDAWHHADLDLNAMLHAANPNAASYVINWMAIGDSGWLGNARNVQYWFDNFHYVPIVGGAPLKTTVQLADITGVKAVSVVTDDKPKTVPTTSNSTPGDQFQTNSKGRRWLHVRAQNGAGEWSATTHLPLILDAAAPKIALVSPADQARAAPVNMQWTIGDDVMPDVSSLALRVGTHDYNAKSAALIYDSHAGKLTWDAGSAVDGGFEPLKNGARVDWKLSPIRDFGGNSAPEQSGSWIYDYALDKIGPSVRVSSSTHPALAHFDFENGRRFDALEGATAAVTEGGAESASPNHALRISNSSANGSLGAVAVGAFDATQWNVVSFRYRIPREANLALRVRPKDGAAWHIRLNGEANDSLGSARNISTREGIKADNQWHWMQFDILPLLRRAPKIEPTQIAALEFIDPLKKTAANVAFEIDDFVLGQAAPSPFKASWRGVDLAGATKYRVAWNQAPETAPIEETADTARELAGAAGTWFLHLQAQDGAGNWGAVTHFPVLIR